MSVVYMPFFAWMILIVSVSWTLPKRLQVNSITLLTGAFLLYYAPISFAILTLTSVCTFYLVKNAGTRLALIVICTAIFLFFKMNSRVNIMMVDDSRLIPLGMSYYLFRIIHYIIETHKGKITVHDFSTFLSYMFFFPVILVGPINRYGDFERDLRRRRWDSQLFSEGLERILYGFVKVIFIGNYLVGIRLNNYIASAGEYPALVAYLGCVSYGCTLYFLFSGYSDIAIGIARLMGFKIMENFDYPFLARNINDFWHRWHNSLSSWCRDYIYTPTVGFSRKPYIAAIVSMLVLGLWHEISWRFVVWALYHGVGIAVWQIFQTIKSKPEGEPGKISLADLVSILFTLNFVILSFAITKETDLTAAINLYKTIFNTGGWF